MTIRSTLIAILTPESDNRGFLDGTLDFLCALSYTDVQEHLVDNIAGEV